MQFWLYFCSSPQSFQVKATRLAMQLEGRSRAAVNINDDEGNCGSCHVRLGTSVRGEEIARAGTRVYATCFTTRRRLGGPVL
jgi:predicted lipoprotein